MINFGTGTPHLYKFSQIEIHSLMIMYPPIILPRGKLIPIEIGISFSDK